MTCWFWWSRYEWQYFAQGTDGRLYPWGNADDPSLTPALSNNFTNPGPEPVGKYPGGASPFKIQDLVSVWETRSTCPGNALVVRSESIYILVLTTHRLPAQHVAGALGLAIHVRVPGYPHQSGDSQGRLELERFPWQVSGDPSVL